jgi:hypothetical protein
MLLILRSRYDSVNVRVDCVRSRRTSRNDRKTSYRDRRARKLASPAIPDARLPSRDTRRRRRARTNDRPHGDGGRPRSRDTRSDHLPHHADRPSRTHSRVRAFGTRSRARVSNLHPREDAPRWSRHRGSVALGVGIERSLCERALRKPKRATSPSIDYFPNRIPTSIVRGGA